jgi:hypothetical protein
MIEYLLFIFHHYCLYCSILLIIFFIIFIFKNLVYNSLIRILKCLRKDLINILEILGDFFLLSLSKIIKF